MKIKLKKKFTLLELMVIIAIIGILVSILIPVLSKSREKARLALCGNNERQIGIALFAFCEDNDNRFPTSYSGAWVGGTYINRPVANKDSWDTQIGTYLSGREYPDGFLFTGEYESISTQVFLCPTDETKRSCVDDARFRKKTYAANRYIKNDSRHPGVFLNAATDTTIFSRKLTHIVSPSGTILFTEKWGGAPTAADMMLVGRVLNYNEGIYSKEYYDTFITYSYLYPEIFMGHDGNGKVNMAMTDGSVHYMNARSTLGESNPSDALLSKFNAER
ncbi:hypothetical protein LNTAR_17043 [Lentisphaera araneosa HTCC2155]|uniref:DUF1559 domain-containing protein n=1 Tax=Lentisphaera araneosa HTCC2155 TaxID=313628 RepID=A6DF97_9BACT|nr:type II secretion system protein [Lentisphaera araneosa]EDM29477.1 hypothetical protein LNTAR_17043 [Lentisphaera araneosa HTCC2155]